MKSIFVSFILIIIISTGWVQAQSCVGPAGQVKWSYWSNFAVQGTSDLTDVMVLENYPDRPDGSQLLGSLRAPVNYTDYYAGMIRGFIKVPQSGAYLFNLTCDDRGLFFLSSDQSPANKVKRAEVTSYTGLDEHNKEPGQTSGAIQLTGGQYYYFEVYNFEGTGGDHLTLSWKKASNPDNPWAIIDFNYIYEYTCGQSCPERGTPCNDGNALTTDDKQDGFCNCVGVAPTANPCVGARGLVEAYYYDNITGNYVENDLINSPKFPLLPDRKEKLKGAYGPLPATPIYAGDNYGTLVQGFLTVPVSGNYEFNITGDNQTFFFLSKNDSMEYKQYHQALVMIGVDETDHTNSVFQAIAPVYLEKGKYYYYEFRHKENNWRDHFNLYWKTPFHQHKVWKRVPAFYLFDYKCEVSCIAQGTPCNDEDPFTNDDRINANCECVGTPCSGPDCNDESARYKVYDSCSPTNNLSTLSEVSWVSCGTLKPNPNAARTANKNWIMYDFASRYKFQDTHVWNYNVSGETGKGFKSVHVDYSTDGTNWQPLGGQYSWPQAPGNVDYAGFGGPNFNDVKARYVLISAAENWGDASCSGFSKITFNATLCEAEGTACDDGDPLTQYDKFDNNCNCRGININCAGDSLKLERMSLSNGEFKAIKGIVSQSSVSGTKDISFTAGNSIVLLPGFEVDKNSVFRADIVDCMQQAFVNNENARKGVDEKSFSDFRTDSTDNDKLKKIVFRINKPGQVKLQLKDKNENTVVTIIDSFFQNLGTQIKYLPINKLRKELYWIDLEVDGKIMREELNLSQ